VSRVQKVSEAFKSIDRVLRIHIAPSPRHAMPGANTGARDEIRQGKKRSVRVAEAKCGTWSGRRNRTVAIHFVTGVGVDGIRGI